MLPYLNENLSLKRDHPYFAQVQAQMSVIGLTRAYFVVYTVTDMHIEIIHFDFAFWSLAVAAVEKFFMTHVLHEIQTSAILKKDRRCKTDVCL